MKATSIFASILVFTFTMYCAQSFAQSGGIAADKQKQANLEKNKARQAEMKKKYNSLTPEQAAEAEKRARAYKNGGYKGQTGSKNTPAVKPSTGPASKTTPAVKPVQKSTPVSGTTKAKPIFLDANGKPINKATPPTNGKPEVSPAKVTPVKPAVQPANKTIQKTVAPKAKTTATKSSTVAPVKK